MPTYRWSTATEIDSDIPYKALRDAVALSDGRLAVLYTDNSAATGQMQVRLLNGDGSPTGDAPILVASFPTDVRPEAELGATDAGGFVVSYTAERPSGARDVMLRSYEADGTSAGPATRVATTNRPDEALIDLVPLSDGGWGVVWQASPLSVTLPIAPIAAAVGGGSGPGLTPTGDPNDLHLLFRLFDADFTPRTGQILVATRDGTVADPADSFNRTSAAAQGDGGLAIQHQDFGPFARLKWYDSTGVETANRQFRAEVFQGIGGVSDGVVASIGENEMRLTAEDGSYLGYTTSLHLDDPADWYNRVPEVEPAANGSLVYGTGRQDSPVGGAYDVLLIEDSGAWDVAGRNILHQEAANWSNSALAPMPDGRIAVFLDRVQGSFDSRTYHRDIFLQFLDPREGGLLVNGSVRAEQIGGTRAGDDIRGFLGDDMIWAQRGDDRVMGEDGDDLIRGQGGNDILDGGAGNDTLAGGHGDDRLTGGEGDDDLTSGPGSDWLAGGEGNDTYTIDSLSDIVTEEKGAGIDLIRSGAVSLVLADKGHIEHASLLGDAALDLTGNGRANILTGNAGPNIISGGNNADTLLGGDGGDELLGGGGQDSIEGGAGDDTAVGGSGNDRVFGGGGNDDLAGLAGRDRIDGQLGDDALQGGAENDTLIGGAGNDSLTGGPGVDRFVLRSGDGTDTAFDFTPGTDRLVLSPDLWTGVLTRQAVLDEFATEADGSTALSFPGGESIDLLGATDLAPGDLLLA